MANQKFHISKNGTPEICSDYTGTNNEVKENLTSVDKSFYKFTAYKVNEPQKPVVPKYVADFYEAIKDDFENKVYDLCVQFDSDNDELRSEVWKWFEWVENEPIQTLVKMKLYGYEIEKEKLYTVEIPDPNSYYNYRFLSRNCLGVCIDASNHIGWKSRRENHITEAEIKQDFEWAFQFAKPVEEEEW